MSHVNFDIRLKEFCAAFGWLQEILAVSRDSIGRDDAVIQRFEFNYELAWKTLKTALEIEGIVVALPHAAFQKAYAAGWINDEQLWLNMLSDRNLMSHLYKEEDAIAVAARVPQYVPAFQGLIVKMDSLEKAA